MRFRSIFNWLLLCFNILLLVFLVRTWLLPLDQAVARARKDAAELGMDVYFARSPFTLFVDKDFPRNEAFTFFDYSQPLIVSVEDVDGNGDGVTKEVAIVLGADFSMSCVYSIAEGIQVHELTLYKKNEGFTDINADGLFDIRIPIPCDSDHPPETWYKGKWQKVIRNAKGGKYQKQLVGGEVVSFDMQSGLWLSPTDKPASGGDEGTTSP